MGNIMSNIVLSQFAVRDSDGAVDVEETVTKFRGALSTFITERETEETRIFEEIDNVLSANVGVRTNLDYVTGEVARKLNATALNHTLMKNKVADLIRQNACGEKDGKPIDRESDEELSSPKRYFMGKGRDGGVSSWETRLQTQAEKAAKKAASAKK